jgi:hypothetical protein
MFSTKLFTIDFTENYDVGRVLTFLIKLMENNKSIQAITEKPS